MLFLENMLSFGILTSSVGNELKCPARSHQLAITSPFHSRTSSLCSCSVCLNGVQLNAAVKWDSSGLFGLGQMVGCPS